MLQNILFQILALISNIVTQPGRQASFHTVWFLFETGSDAIPKAPVARVLFVAKQRLKNSVSYIGP
jgi:hypothetical protein